MPKPIDELKNSHPDSTIYVLAAGASMNTVCGSFFKDKIVIAVNETYKFFPAQYIVVKEKESLWEAVRSFPVHRAKIVASEYDCGDRGIKNTDFAGEFYYFKHLPNRHTIVNLAPLDNPGWLVVSYSTITSAVHLAYFLGASNIVLCGHDCGSIDGEFYFRGYNPPMTPEAYKKAKNFITQFEPQTLTLVNELRVKGINVYSLNPFINLGLEGHTYERR